MLLGVAPRINQLPLASALMVAVVMRFVLNASSPKSAEKPHMFLFMVIHLHLLYTCFLCFILSFSTLLL
jgi:hypothetical protein